MTICAYFQDGPLQGEYRRLPNFTDRYLVNLPARIEVRCEGDYPIGPAFEVGQYVVDHLSRRFDFPGTSIARVPTYTYVWKGTNNMRTAENIHRLIGRPPLTLKHVSECDEVIIDGATLIELIRLAERAHERTTAGRFEVTATVDGEVLPIRLASVANSASSSTVDLPVRRAGEPHRLTVTIGHRR